MLLWRVSSQKLHGVPSLGNYVPRRCGSSDLAKILDGGKEGGRDLDMIEVIEEIARGVGRGWCSVLFAYLRVAMGV